MSERAPARCCYCGRHPRTCWTMPCLQLSGVLEQGDDAIVEWGRESGLRVYLRPALKPLADLPQWLINSWRAQRCTGVHHPANDNQVLGTFD